jgi:hypothetical protein
MIIESMLKAAYKAREGVSVFCNDDAPNIYVNGLVLSVSEENVVLVTLDDAKRFECMLCVRIENVNAVASGSPELVQLQSYLSLSSNQATEDIYRFSARLTDFASFLSLSMEQQIVLTFGYFGDEQENYGIVVRYDQEQAIITSFSEYGDPEGTLALKLARVRKIECLGDVEANIHILAQAKLSGAHEALTVRNLPSKD